MTKSVSFNVRLESDPTKLDEIKVLHKMFNEFKGSGTYLEMLFSDALTEFVQNQIMNDFSPQVDEYLDTQEQEDEIRDLRRKVDKWEKLAKYRLNDINELVKEIETMKDHQVTELDNLRAEKNAHIDRMLDERDAQSKAKEFWAAESAVAHRNVDDLNRLVSEQVNEINELKAKMFDMMMANNQVEVVSLADDREYAHCLHCGAEVLWEDAITFNDGLPFCSERHGEVYCGEKGIALD